MKRILGICALLALLSAAFTSCRSTKTLLPSVSGKAGEVIVVIDKQDWEGNLGSGVRELLAADCPYLVQKEPLYSLVNVPPTGFVDIFKVHRNIVFFNLDPRVTSSDVTLKKDVWAHPQCLIVVNAPDADAATELIKENSSLILGDIEQAERDRVISNTLLYEEKSLAPQVEEIFGGSPHFPSGYKLKKKTPDFVWIADEKQYTNQGIFIYSYPADEENPFTVENIVAHRNAILKENVPGMFDNTYMTTSEFIEPEVEYLKYKGRTFAQTRGFWEVYNDYMGGPFVSHSFYSPDGLRIVVADAFVYAPKYDKRQYLRQVESLLYSFEWAAEKE